MSFFIYCGAHRRQFWKGTDGGLENGILFRHHGGIQRHLKKKSKEEGRLSACLAALPRISAGMSLLRLIHLNRDIRRKSSPEMPLSWASGLVYRGDKLSKKRNLDIPGNVFACAFEPQGGHGVQVWQSDVHRPVGRQDDPVEPPSG
jgi:hypothetical protein